jgi:predicted SAM-dependent methyltransferase
VCDIREGLPVPDDTFDYAVSIHALEQVPFPEVVPVLEELRRVLKPAGVLRLSVPDLDRAIDAYRRGDRVYFQVPDSDAVSVGGKLCVQMTWYGTSRLLLTYDFLAELLDKARFTGIRPCAFGRTESQHPGIVELDDRERESLFVEAVK